MRILIPTFNRPTSHLTARTLHEGGVTGWTYVVHDDAQRAMYEEHWPKDIPQHIIISDVPRDLGLGGQRAWIDDEINLNEWYIQMDDNVQQFTKMKEPHYSRPFDKNNWERGELDELFNSPIPANVFMDSIIPEMIAKCEYDGAKLGGFAITKNPFFRGKKWTKIGFIVGKILLIQKNDKAFFDASFFTSDDYQISAEHLLAFGKICRNNFVYPEFPRYMTGGLGKLPERQAPYAKAAKQLIEKYPGAFLINYNRKDMDPGSAVKLRFNDRSEKSLEKWRQQLLASR